MQIIIDIPKEKYDLCKKWKPSERNELQEAVANGIPLPKGHGRLKDIDKIIRDGISKGFCEWYDEMKYAPTIIEADKAEQGQKARNDNEYSS